MLERSLPAARLLIVLVLCAIAICPPITHAQTAADPAADAAVTTTNLPTRTLHDLLADIQGRLVEVRKLDLRRTEAEAELAHIRQSRMMEVDIDGNYRNEDLHREEINGDNFKEGHNEDIHRNLTFAFTRPLLGLPLEQRVIVANEEQRLVELRETTVLARREAILEVVQIFVELEGQQDLLPLRERAVALAEERVRMVEARQERGETLQRDVLAARAQLAGRVRDLAHTRFRIEELFSELSQSVDGPAPAPFRAAALDWAAMAPSRVPAAPDSTAPPPEQPTVSGLWYTLPEIDLTFFYTMQSRDRRFADEVDSEEGHTPGVQLSVEFPLDAYRAARSYARQARARAERQRIAVESLARQTRGVVRQVSLAHQAAQ
ncbi:MAG TPA: TolC family protein, partial [Candidatus Udaeobacter sp.]|nr:TolC family protein [Candidatus Udaeobacter sp.]